ncbi:MAG: hypothetical protein QOE41_969 [Mycobacterium sp.]|nr:hypothetical protein [Mycobacterium sp.]
MRVDRGALHFRAAQPCCPRPQQELIDVVSGDVAGEPDVLKTLVIELRGWHERKWVRIMSRYRAWHRMDGHRLGSTTPSATADSQNGRKARNHEVTR